MGAKRSIVKENKNGRRNSQNAEKRSRKKRNPKAVRQLTALYVALVLAAAGAIGGGVFWAVHSTRVTEELIAENTQESTTEEESTVPAAIEETEETFYIENLYLRRVLFTDKTCWKDLTGAYSEYR